MNEYLEQLRERNKTNPEKVLVAKKSTIEGAMHGWASNGLPMLDLGNGYGLQIIAHEPTTDGKKWRTIQLYKYAIDSQPANQTYIRTKVKYIKPEKKEKEKIEFTENKTKTLF